MLFRSVRYFNEQGYYTYGSHPSYKWFYNRENINVNLGFQNYSYFENRYERLTDGSIAMDNIFFDDLYDMYREHLKKQEDKWCFSFNVTYQNHGPYEDYLTISFLTPSASNRVMPRRNSSSIWMLPWRLQAACSSVRAQRSSLPLCPRP